VEVAEKNCFCFSQNYTLVRDFFFVHVWNQFSSDSHRCSRV